MEIGRRTAKDIQGIKEEDNKLTGSHSSKKRGKFSSRNQCYESKLEELSSKTTLVLNNTRELNRNPFTK